MHKAVFHRLDDAFFGPKTPAVGKAINSVAEETEVFPVGLDGPGFFFL